VLLRDDLFADYFEPDEVLQLEGDVTELHLAAAEGNVEVIRGYATCPEFINARGVNGETPLWCAAMTGSVGAVEALIELGADVDLPNEEGATPVDVAAQEGHLGVVKALASVGADVNLPDRNGWSPVWRKRCAGVSRRIVK
jgi:ankyrin repeat protein